VWLSSSLRMWLATTVPCQHVWQLTIPALFFPYTGIHLRAQGQVADAAPGDLFDIGGGVKMHMLCQGGTITPAYGIRIVTRVAQARPPTRRRRPSSLRAWKLWAR
jgi:hypothetical protein